MSKISHLLLLLYCLLANRTLAQSSVLASGKWLKMGITQTGVYKLDAAFFNKNGVDITKINPKNIKIYGNGGSMLPQSNAIARPNDLIENAILIGGENDGQFNTNDYLLFYGQGSHLIQIDNNTNRLVHQTNVYSDSSFYFLNIADNQGQRVAQTPFVKGQQIFSNFDDYVFLESDQKNILNTFPFAGSGREWYGQEFNSTSLAQEFTFNLPNIVANSPILVRAAVLAMTQATSDFSFSLNGQPIGNQKIGAIGTDRYDVKGLEANTSYITSLATPNNQIKLGITFNRNGTNTGQGFLNYVGIQTKRALTVGTEQMPFCVLESANFQNNNYQLQSTDTGLMVWDISNHLLPTMPTLNKTGNSINFGSDGNKIHRFIAFSLANTLSPENSQWIDNQNIKGNQTPNLLIITAPKFLEKAQNLADFRTKNDGIKVLVVTTNQVFNEFSSGRLDVSAIRDVARFFYKKDPKTFQSLLLFGDAKFDYKNRLLAVPTDNLNDYVPIYESRESLNPIYSYSSDDYFGFLEDHEGEWTENFNGDHTLDIGVGRLPVKSIAEAKDIVTKLSNYASNQAASQITFVADDGDYNIHQQDADFLAEEINRDYPVYEINKIFLDAYNQTSSASGQRALQVNSGIKSAMNNSLIVNYTGHGGTAGWAEEQILTAADIQSWRNTNYPLMVTATCEFGRYDDPNVVSGAELALLSKNAGAIALITTTRPVFANTNFLVNEAFYQAIFKPINEKMPTLGQAMIQTKNNSLSGRINRNFSLLGDPSMTLAYPTRKIVLTKLNGKNTLNDTLKALQTISLEAEILEKNHKNRDVSINLKGLKIKIFDKETVTTTKGSQSNPMLFKEQKDLIFNGVGVVKDGLLKLTFTLPKDINYQIGKGKIYFSVANFPLVAKGSANLTIGGAEAKPKPDTTPPNANIFVLNNAGETKSPNFINKNSFFVANLSDSSGINLNNNSIGHEISLVLDDSLKYNLNQYYTPSDDFTNTGSVTFPLFNLNDGPHQLVFQVWDIYNNLTRKTLNFIVKNQGKKIWNLQARPNPFASTTTIDFQTNFYNEGQNIEFEIFDTSGRLIKQQSRTFYQNESYPQSLDWDGTNNDGIIVAKGIYYYRIFVTSLSDGQQAIGSGKVAKF